MNEKIIIFLFLLPIISFYILVWLYPLLLVVLQSFGIPALTTRAEGEYPTLTYYATFFSTRYLDYLWFSFWNSLAAVLLALVIGYFTALIAFIYEFKGKRVFNMISKIPLFVPYLIAAFMWWLLLTPRGYVYDLLLHLGLINEQVKLANDPLGIGIIFANVWMHIPYVMLISIGTLKVINPELIEAARVLGANMRRTIRYVFIPLSIPGILASLQLVFISMFGGFSVAYILGASFPNYLSVRIFEDAAVLYKWSFASVGAVIYLVTSLVITYFYSKITRWGLKV